MEIYSTFIHRGNNVDDTDTAAVSDAKCAEHNGNFLLFLNNVQKYKNPCHLPAALRSRLNIVRNG